MVAALVDHIDHVGLLVEEASDSCFGARQPEGSLHHAARMVAVSSRGDPELAGAGGRGPASLKAQGLAEQRLSVQVTSSDRCGSCKAPLGSRTRMHMVCVAHAKGIKCLHGSMEHATLSICWVANWCPTKAR